MSGLNILTGFNGQISLGHGAFYAIGASTTLSLLTVVRRLFPLPSSSSTAISNRQLR
jgi:ABC-type branched-subunit amino acid transport system permease subunit